MLALALGCHWSIPADGSKLSEGREDSHRDLLDGDLWLYDAEKIPIFQAKLTARHRQPDTTRPPQTERFVCACVRGCPVDSCLAFQANYLRDHRIRRSGEGGAELMHEVRGRREYRNAHILSIYLRVVALG